MADRPPRERMREAVRAVRREGRKAAALNATAEGVAAVLAVSLGLSVAGSAAPAVLASPVPLPASLPAAVGPVRVPATVETGSLVAAGAGFVVAAAGYLLRARRPAVERFESVNPPVAEALRTARDSLRADREGQLADRLYESVLASLRDCSSLGLIDVRRVAAILALVGALAVANVGVVVVDVGVGGAGTQADGATDAPAAGGTNSDYGGLQDPDSVLGDPEDVSAGDDEVNATLPTQGGGEGSGTTDGSYASGGFATDTTVESQQAGFAETERLEDAELIREYNLRIREEDG